MSLPAAIVILILLLCGPLAVRIIEENIEAYIFVLGVIATLTGTGFDLGLLRRAAEEPILISVAVIAAGIAFSFTRRYLDELFARLRRRISRPILAATSIFALGIASSIITAIVAALVLVEVIALLRLQVESRTRVAIAGCFSIGLGAALTPIGEPLSALAAAALHLPFRGLFDLLAPWMLPGSAAAAVLAGYFARGHYDEGPHGHSLRESPMAALMQGVRVYVFVAGLVLVSRAYAPLAGRFIEVLSDDALFWINTVSAALDNATLVALEVHNMTLPRARAAIIALLVSGGILIPGNIPNIISAGALGIRSTTWARIAGPIGLAALGIYFALLKLLA